MSTRTPPAFESQPGDPSQEDEDVLVLRAAPAMTLTEAQDWLRRHSHADTLVAEELPGTLPLWCLPGKRLALEGWSLCQEGLVAGRYRVCESFTESDLTA